MKQDFFLGCVHCYTFNHAPYIQDTLNGFALQRTTFPFVCSIIDDASTDGTQEVIKKYLESKTDIVEASAALQEETDDYVLTFVRHKENVNCYFAVFFLKYNHYSLKKPKVTYHEKWNGAKYIAFCEGDDYWTYPYKLQNQVDLLENNLKVGMCYAKCRYYYQRKKKYSKEPWGGPYVSLKDMVRKNTVPTLSVVCRSDLYWQYCKQYKPSNWLMGDYPIWLFFAAESEVAFMDIEVGTYRVLDESASHTSSMEKKMKFAMSQIDIMDYFDNKYNVGYGHDYFDSKRDLLRLRTYAIYHKIGPFFRELSIIRKKSSRRLGLAYYKYFLLLVLPGMSKIRQ